MARRRRAPAPAAPDPDLANLRKINHIVVLMLENRSFDHMLGYLTLEAGRPDVDGLKASMANMHRGKRYKVRHLQRTALTRDEDPGHSGASTAEQVSGNMGGFVSNFAREKTRAKLVDIPMGYYNGSDLPVYDHLTREFCACDRWFCSVPGATWPNRLYAACGQAAGSKDGRRVPIYDVPSFVRHLETQQGALALVLARRRHASLHRREVPSWLHGQVRVLRPTQLARAAELPRRRERRKVAGRLLDRPELRRRLVHRAVGVERRSPALGHQGGAGARPQDRTPRSSTARSGRRRCSIVTYDEHGGFFDHVLPPAAHDDRPAFRTYGVRVPALVVSPFTERASVSNVAYDHTSIIKTILMRFCRKNGQIPNMGARVANANHLGGTLKLAQPRPPTPTEAFRDAVDRITAWRADVFRSRVLMEPITTPADPTNLTDLQEQVLAAKKVIRAEGLPEGQP